MRPSLATPALVLVTSYTTSIGALQALSSSPCAVKCGNVLGSTTGEDDIACYDNDFHSLSKARVFKECVSCQINSTYVDATTKQTDLRWALYNLRYAVSWCLYGYPSNPKFGPTPCYTWPACGPLEHAFEFDSLSPNASTFEYCPLLDPAAVGRCTECMSHSDEFFITTYVTALHAACQQHPNPGSTISIEGSLFSDIRTNITDPKASSRPNTSNSSPALTLGAKVGIAVGAIATFLVLSGCCIIWHGKRRRRADLLQCQRRSGYAEWNSRLPPTHQPGVGSNAAAFSPASQLDHTASGRGVFFASPQSHRSLPPWAVGQGVGNGDSPVGEKAYFSPYTSPMSASEQVQVSAQEWPTDDKAGGRGSEADRVQHLRSRSRDKGEREGVEDPIEMQNVPPVVLHPGNGRV